MSGDLISKSRLMEDIRNTITENSSTLDWLNLISRQPTAYDVDKVVERLEEEVKYQNEKAEEEPLFCELTFEEARRKMAECYEHAIEIVKAGGVK